MSSTTNRNDIQERKDAIDHPMNGSNDDGESMNSTLKKVDLSSCKRVASGESYSGRRKMSFHSSTSSIIATCANEAFLYGSLRKLSSPIKRFRAARGKFAPRPLSVVTSLCNENLFEQISGSVTHEFDGTGTGCCTPKGQEQRVPNPPFECPPPPKKKQFFYRRHINHVQEDSDCGSAEIISTHDGGKTDKRHPPIGASFFRPPADLHIYPESIRALFER
ncbi:hypothetical protein KP509_36G006300 [Ceratopteris richardii]|uniref:Uncharacterized protein n=1 Tax=Ceratopteris richardii TaxID=49495 RepID=A0A8T2QBL1_CERRI|nr:hypothetical protein KP509_36G006300 [Ceratopteris richardii]